MARDRREQTLLFGRNGALDSCLQDKQPLSLGGKNESEANLPLRKMPAPERLTLREAASLHYPTGSQSDTPRWPSVGIC